MSLRRKINLALLLGLTMTLLLYAIVDISISQSNLREQAELGSENTARRLGITLADPMWNFNVSNARKVAEAELGTNDLVGVQAFDNENNALFNVHWDVDAQRVVEGSYPKEFLFKKNQTIQFNDQGDDFDAGRVELTYSSYTLDNAFTAAVKRSVVQVIILDVIILVLMGFLVHKLILTPLDGITNRVNDIAQGQGDLTKRVDFTSGDELGKLAKGINAFIENVHNIIRDISDVAHRLDKTADTGQNNIDALNAQVSSLDSQVEQIVKAVHDLNETSKDVALQASDSAKVSQETNNLAESGMREVNEANQITRELANSIQDSTSKTEQLEQYSQSINTVIEVIMGIAEQTNLLALNAAIEAARAGEQGRGFAVVADEVRTLAQRTQESTGQITDIIAQLQEQSLQTLTLMKQGLEKSEANVSSVAQAGSTFENIREAIQRSTEGASEIAKDAEEQNHTLSSIEQSVDLIKAANGKTLLVARKSADTNEEIAQMSHAVSDLVEKFKI